MKNIIELVEESKCELDLLGIKYQEVRTWTVNSRAKCRWGQCKMLSNGVFDISISARLLEDDVDNNVVKSTIIHELLHTVEDCFGHGEKWKMLALKVNQAYPDYNIKRISTAEEKGIKSDIKEYKKNHKIVCIECGYFVYRQRAGKLVLHPEKFRCGKCGGILKVYY